MSFPGREGTSTFLASQVLAMQVSLERQEKLVSWLMGFEMVLTMTMNIVTSCLHVYCSLLVVGYINKFLIFMNHIVVAWFIGKHVN